MLGSRDTRHVDVEVIVAENVIIFRHAALFVKAHKVYLVIACLPGIGCSGAVIAPENHVSAACRFKRVLVEICVVGSTMRGRSAVGNGAEILLKVTEAAVRGHDAAVSC